MIIYFGIKASDSWTSVVALNKGWSKDKKFVVHTDRGEKLLLRLSDAVFHDEKAKEFAIMQKYAGTLINMSQPLEFGLCEDRKSVYILLSWLEGEDLEAVLPKLPESEQTGLGREAGKILKTIHSISLAPEDVPKETKVAKKLLQLDRYMNSGVRIENDSEIIEYVRANIDLMWRRKPVYLHGDFHPGNLIYLKDGSLGVIDFNRWEVGDPYEEFYKLQSFGIESSPVYCAGQIDSYFDDDVPDEFWQTLAVYVAHTSLFSIKWAEQFGKDDIDGMVRRCRAAIRDYDNFKRTIPKWYEEVKNAKTVGQ